jgi:hypothetical protein
MRRVMQNSVRGGGGGGLLVILMPGKKPERRPGLHPFEKKLPKRRSSAFHHKSAPGLAPEFTA